MPPPAAPTSCIAVPINVEPGKLVSVPYSIELNDSPLFRVNYEADYFAEICKRQFRAGEPPLHPLMNACS